MDSADQNPFASPQAIAENPVAELTVAEAEEFRTANLRRERRFRKCGFCLMSLMLLANAVWVCVFCDTRQHLSQSDYAIAAGYFVCLLVSSISYYGVRRMAAWSRIPLTAVATVGLVASPIGTILGILLLTGMYFGLKPRPLSREYERIVLATPQIQFSISLFASVVIALLVLVITSLVVFVFFFKPYS